MRFHVLTLFPDAFQGPVDHSIVGLARRRGLISIDITDIRTFTDDAHGTADDYQFGGGHGMVLKPEPIFRAVKAVLDPYASEERDNVPVILFSPQGRVLDQGMVERLAEAPALVLVCGHYSGVDERVVQHLATQVISVGDYVLSGGELPAMTVIEAVSRLVPGVVGAPENVVEDSISSGLLQHPLYTRPAEFQDMAVPEVLRSGHHAEITRWRRRESLRRTLEHRPDLLERADLTPEDLEFLGSLGYVRSSPPRC
ncbi:MAG: tRNA (guanosine(37)-N1)-methyltransferase TrmD [SAR202 cluster bacterium Io17-Chloro-G9]|nr:MAG: tRNA (guanosine(37)-N1)-methyltransferase TrmD [SAR202 cluster bacterium Io17-Chloro-G9]